MSGDPPSKWAAVAADYADGALTVAQICARYEITQNALYAQAKKQGWPRRRARYKTGMPAGRRRGPRRTLIARLYRALEQKMSEFETRLADGAQTAADSERDARTLNTMVRLFERLGVLEEKASAGRAQDNAKPGGSSADDDIAADARALREDLARRLERLRAERGD